jgi:GlpG protein
MSGVLYGLFGYMWIRSHADPGSGLGLAPATIMILLVWFFLCLANVIPGVANACHVAGLILGMILGAAPLIGRVF